MSVGEAYDQLRMHCTLVHRFHSKLSPSDLATQLEPVLAGQPVVTLSAGEHVAFGPQKQLVTLVQQTDEIQFLHQRLYDFLNQLGVHYTEAEWVGQGYTPHVTDKNGKRLSHSQPSISAAIYLIAVEHPLRGRRRFIHKKFNLAAL